MDASASVKWLCLVVCLCSTVAKIEKVTIANDDRPIITLSEGFAFGSRGRIEVIVKRVEIKIPHAKVKQGVNGNRFGFLLSSVDGETTLEEELDSSQCPLTRNTNQVSVLQLFSEPHIMSIIEKNSTWHKMEFNVPPGLHYLYFANCEEGYAVSFKARIAMYNVLDNGKKDYLSIGDTELDTVYWIMFALFAVATGAWGYVLYTNKDSVHKIHYLMLVLAVFKCLTLMSQALMMHYVELYGKPDGWNIAYYVFTFFRGLLFFSVVILIGTGWSYMKPFIGDKEKNILLIVLPLQVFANIAIVVMSEESPALKDWFTWRDVFHLVDIVCCCAILFPIVWSIKHLRDASQTDGKAARVLEKLTLFRQFYIMVVVYIYFTRIAVYLLKSSVAYQYSWVSEGAEQLATLAFYVWTASKFRPHQENPYLKLSQEEIDA